MRLRTYCAIATIALLSTACAQGAKTADQPASPAPAATPQAASKAATPAPPAAGAPAAAAPKVESTDARLMCTRANDSRLLKLDRLEPKGCRLMYPNAASEIAASSVGTGHCEKVRDNIRKNLENVGFKCSTEQTAKVEEPAKKS